MAEVLEARDTHRSYGHVRSLQGASLEVGKGEVVALIGDNGAGKSTPTKALPGVVQVDAGKIYRWMAIGARSAAPGTRAPGSRRSTRTSSSPSSSTRCRTSTSAAR